MTCSAVRWLVVVTFLLCQMPFVPLLAGALAATDGGHEVIITQSDYHTHITLHHRDRDPVQERQGYNSTGYAVDGHPDHQIDCASNAANRTEDNVRLLKHGELQAICPSICFLAHSGPIVESSNLFEATTFHETRDSVSLGLRETVLLI